MEDVLIEFLDSLRDYMHESGNNLAYDDRESKELIKIFMKGRNLPKLPVLDKPVVCIQGERIALDKVLGYGTFRRGLYFKVHGAVNEGEEAHFAIKFNTIEEAKNCAKWLDSLLNVVEYKPETLQNRE